MEKTRTLKELYQVALENYKNNNDYQRSGLCSLVECLRYGHITEEETKLLLKSLRKNAPTKFLHREFYTGRDISGFWWPAGQTFYRRAFLEKMINYVELPWYLKLWDRLK